MARIKIRVAYKDLNEGERAAEILAYGFGDINPYDSKSIACDEMAGAMAYNIAKGRAGHDNIKLVGYGHEEVIDE